MGLYINPPGDKLAWLETYGIETDEDQDTLQVPDRLLLVCLVDNGGFTAAGIATDEQELDRFRFPLDHRPKRWFFVNREDARQYCDPETWQVHMGEEVNG